MSDGVVSERYRGHAARRAAVAAAGQRAAGRSGSGTGAARPPLRALRRRLQRLRAQSAGGRAGAGRCCGGCYAKLRAEGQRGQEAVASGLGPQVPGLLLLGGRRARSSARWPTRRWTTFKQRIRQLTRRYGRAQHERGRRATCGPTCRAGRRTSGWRKRREIWRELDEWLRHRLRAMQLKHWRARHDDLPGTAGTGREPGCWRQRVAGNARRWWRNSRMGAQPGAAHRLLRPPRRPRLS